MPRRATQPRIRYQLSPNRHQRGLEKRPSSSCANGFLYSRRRASAMMHHHLLMCNFPLGAGHASSSWSTFAIV